MFGTCVADEAIAHQHQWEEPVRQLCQQRLAGAQLGCPQSIKELILSGDGGTVRYTFQSLERLFLHVVHSKASGKPDGSKHLPDQRRWKGSSEVSLL